MKILVGMSGGVDSSCTAMLLKQQGHEVIGVTMAIWGDRGIKTHFEKNQRTHGACFGPDEKEDIEEARKISEQIGIPFYVFDCSNNYNEIVLDNFKKEYLSGSTPNPCIWCNSLIKFGVLPQMARLQGIEFDKFATGHYARNVFENGRYVLKRGLDEKKDQSYFLYRLSQEQLENILLPLGEFSKDKIRKLALEYGLKSAQKPDSQDFYAGDYNDILEVEPKIGNIVNTEGKVLGVPNGFWNYTIGQRRGLGVSADKPLYVIELKSETNEVVVGKKDKTMKDKLIANDIKLHFENIPQKCKAKIRSNQIPTPVIAEIKDNELFVQFEDMQKSIAKGQSVVLYDNDTILGGGIIKETF